MQVEFDVANGRAANVSAKPPHQGTPLGDCVTAAIRRKARYGAIKDVPNIRRSITF